jgi:hypothetical protein
MTSSASAGTEAESDDDDEAAEADEDDVEANRRLLGNLCGELEVDESSEDEEDEETRGGLFLFTFFGLLQSIGHKGELLLIVISPSFR